MMSFDVLNFGMLTSLNKIQVFFRPGSFHVKSSGDFHGPPPILLKFGTLVGIV